MILLKRIDGREFVVNADEIETVETTHDSTLTLKSGKKFIVIESSQEIIAKVIEFRMKCFSNLIISPDISDNSPITD